MCLWRIQEGVTNTLWRVNVVEGRFGVTMYQQTMMESLALNILIPRELHRVGESIHERQAWYRYRVIMNYGELRYGGSQIDRPFFTGYDPIFYLCTFQLITLGLGIPSSYPTVVVSYRYRQTACRNTLRR